MRTERVEKAVFVVSLTILAFLYGFASNTYGWFPAEFLERAWLQGQLLGSRMTDPPEFVASRVYDRTGARAVDPARIQPGVTLVGATWNEDEDGWTPGVRLLDADGDVLHAWWVDPAEVFPGAAGGGLSWEMPDIHGTHLFPDGDVVLNVDYVGTVRLDACGRIVWRLAHGGHHSVARADDGSFWIPSVSGKVEPRSAEYPEGYPGLTGEIYKDFLTRVTAEGEVTRKLAVLDLLYANGLERHIASAGRIGRSDVTHLNDIEPLGEEMADEYPLFEAGDLAVSLLHLDLVMVVDAETERVKWHTSHPFINQHDPDFTGDGWIGVFDNNTDRTERGSMLGGSRVVSIQPHTDSTRVLFPGPRSEPFYTPYRGKWQRLDNGNLLLIESYAGRVAEVAPDGSTVWDWVTEPYGQDHVPEIGDATRYSLTPDDVASWPCSGVATGRDPQRGAGS